MRVSATAKYLRGSTRKANLITRAIVGQRVEDAAKFSAFSSEDVVERTLPAGVRIEVWTAKQHQAAKTGVAYLYFFPQGYTERAQVWVRQGDNTWTLTISPLTGKTKIHNEDLQVPNT